MGRKSKRFREIASKVDETRTYDVQEAIAILRACPPVKFDQTVDIAVKLGVDPRKADQQVRGSVSLPNGTGRKVTLVVFCKGEKVQEALDAGADYAGSDELLAQVQKGWTDFSAVIATPDMMREVGRLGRVLGPRGLMPTPKAGTVTTDVATAVKEIKAGKVEFRVDRNSGVNNALGKLSFSPEQLEENIETFLQALHKAKPSAAKGQYFRSVSLSSTMGPGLRLDQRALPTA